MADQTTSGEGEYDDLKERQPARPREWPAGWYPDPTNPRLMRFWDGKRWTEHAGARPGGGHAKSPGPARPATTPSRPLFAPLTDAVRPYVDKVRPHVTRRRATAAGVVLLVALAALAWVTRPALHWPVMLLYKYPLVTWLPLVAGLVAGGLVAGLRRLVTGLRGPGPVGTGVLTCVCLWVVSMVMLPAWQGSALYQDVEFLDGAALPQRTQPRLLPKKAAEEYADREKLVNAHLVVDPTTRELAWSAERAGGFLRRTGRGIVLQRLNQVDGRFEERPAEFNPSGASVGPGSVRWRGYKRNFFTDITDRVVVPLGDGRAVTIAPYVGYRGFPVRRPYLKGVYVHHQDGRLEDLSPEEAAQRPELARSGRLFPETLARRIAESYGYRTGPAAVLLRRQRTKVSDPKGNPQPYLTNLGDGRVKWVTVAHRKDSEHDVAAIFLTDATNGRTQVWAAPRGLELLSNQGAADRAKSIGKEFRRRTGYNSETRSATYDWVRRTTEPRPVFLRGELKYLVSIETNPKYVKNPGPIESTVMVDARSGHPANYDHDDPRAVDELRRMLQGERP